MKNRIVVAIIQLRGFGSRSLLLGLVITSGCISVADTNIVYFYLVLCNAGTGE